MITEIKRDNLDMKILVQTKNFDRRPDKFGRITGQVRKSLLESGEKGGKYPLSKIDQSGLPNWILQF
jgi:hypothetical protein